MAAVSLTVAALALVGPVRAFDLGYPAQALTVSADGTHFAVARHGNWIDVCDAATGAVRQSVRFSDGDRVCTLAFSPDGKSLAAAAEHNAELRVWDVATGDQRLAVPVFTGIARSLTYSPDGKTV